MKAKEVNNSERALSAKLELRRNILAHISPARVLDVFAGAGEMWRSVWSEADEYLGCDREHYPILGRPAYVLDSQRMLRCQDLSAFNVFDLDAWGSPWAELWIIASRRPLGAGERVGVCLTFADRPLRSGSNALAFQALANRQARIYRTAAERVQAFDLVLNRCVDRWRATVEKRWRAIGASRAGVRYEALILSGEV